MRILNPDQSVNDVRWIDGDGTKLITFAPGTLVDSLSNTPSNFVWTPPV